MRTSKQLRKLSRKWEGGGWPKWLEWVEIENIRGWAGQRVDFAFPITAIVGENGAGKSTVLQSCAAVYKNSIPDAKSYFASDFFPNTAWDTVVNARIRYSIKQGASSTVNSVRKPTRKWLGNRQRLERPVVYLDLRRTQPISAQVGYWKLTKGSPQETQAVGFDAASLQRLSTILGKQYGLAKHATTDVDANRRVPVVEADSAEYSAFHQGAGETTVIDLLAVANSVPKYGLLLIDEIETSLHPRAQRRLLRDLAEIARINLLQVIVTTHSPYILEELPSASRVYFANTSGGRTVFRGISSEFALSKMDEENHPEVDVYAEDERAAVWLKEMVYKFNSDLLPRLSTVAAGPAEVGKALGRMVHENRFNRPSVVVLDGDQDPTDGCVLLPGGDNPECVVFEGLEAIGWTGVADMLGRRPVDVIDACVGAMTADDHHDWPVEAANSLRVGSAEIWRALAACWVIHCCDQASAQPVIDAITDALGE